MPKLIYETKQQFLDRITASMTRDSNAILLKSLIELLRCAESDGRDLNSSEWKSAMMNAREAIALAEKGTTES